MWHNLVQTVLQKVAFFELLLGIDRDAVNEMHRQNCPHCGGRLDRSDYERKPRSSPEGAPNDFAIRFSLCCSQEGCRKRLTPVSVRFLGRKVYVGAGVVLVAGAMQGASPARIKQLSELLGIAQRTARRWLIWWQTKFAKSNFFKSVRGLVQQIINSDELPLILLKILNQSDPYLTTLAVLKLLRPITSATAPDAQPC